MCGLEATRRSWCTRSYNEGMKFAVAALTHETNTYANEVSGLTSRDAFDVKMGAEMHRYSGMSTYTGGIIDECARLGVEVVPLLAAVAPPSGTITRETYEGFKKVIIDGLRENPGIDAVVLEMHGAGVTESATDLEGDLILAIREVVGPDIPVTAAMDLHGNITQVMAANLDALLGNHLYPHTDCGERGEEAVRVALDAARGTIKPVTELVSLPILLPPSTTDAGFPAHEMNLLCAEVESRPGVIDCTVFHGFPFSDTPHVGVHIVCTTDGDRALAHECANEVASWIWSSRNRFLLESHSPESAMRTAVNHVAQGQTPVVINDTSDNPGGGTPGDGTHLLSAMLDLQVPGSAFAMLYDPEAVEEAIRAGVGNNLDIAIGGKHGPLHGPTLTVTARVRTIADGRIVLSHMLKGLPMNLGPSVGLRVGEVDVVLVSRASQTFDPGIFRLHGIEPQQCSIVGLKSSQHFRAGFNDIAAVILTADSPGLTTLDVTNFDHAAYDGDLWPTRPDLEWEPS